MYNRAINNFKFFASLSESDAIHMLPLLTACENKPSTEIINESSADPSAHIIQKHLAYYMTSLVHNEDLARQSKSLSELLFSSETDFNLSSYNFELLLDSSRFKKLKKSIFKISELTVFEFLKHIFTEFSNNQIRQMIKSGGFRLNRKKIADSMQNIRLDELNEYNLINNGKTSFIVVKLDE